MTDTPIAPFIGKQITFELSATSGGTSIIDGCTIVELGDMSSTFDTVDATGYGVGNTRKFVKTLKDLGEFSFTIQYKDKTVAAALKTAFDAIASYYAKITLPDSATPTTISFTALVTGLGISMSMDDIIKQAITLKLDGSTEITIA